MALALEALAPRQRLELAPQGGADHARAGYRCRLGRADPAGVDLGGTLARTARIVTELLGDVVYDPATHVKPGEEPASRGQTKIRFERCIEAQLPGKDNAPTRSLAKAVVVFAQEVKHSSTPTRRDAGIAWTQ